jgi:muramidase (phage lysozyme)
MIRSAEGTQRFSEPERVNFGNSRNGSDLSSHPGIGRYFNNPAGGPNSTSATGAYQFITKTWNATAKQLDLPDFSRRSQDIAALALLENRGALGDAQAGNVAGIARKAGSEWASLGHNNYRQPTKGLGYLQTAFDAPLADGGTQVSYSRDSGGTAQGQAASSPLRPGAIKSASAGFRTGGGSSDTAGTGYALPGDELLAGVQIQDSLSGMQRLMAEQLRALVGQSDASALSAPTQLPPAELLG